jgi:hypothetical protein
MEDKGGWNLEVAALGLLAIGATGSDWAIVGLFILCFFRFVSWGIIFWRRCQQRNSWRRNRRLK